MEAGSEVRDKTRPNPFCMFTSLKFVFKTFSQRQCEATKARKCNNQMFLL